MEANLSSLGNSSEEVLEDVSSPGSNSSSSGSENDSISNMISYSIPRVSVKVSNDRLLLRLHCDNRKGILPRIFSEVENTTYDLNLINGSVMAFATTAFDITIVAQMGSRCDQEQVKNLERTLDLILQTP